MANMLFYAHSGVRFLVLLAAVIAAVVMLWKWSSGRPYDKQSRVVVAVFVGILNLQFLLGVLNLFTRPFYNALIGHVVMMFVAVAAAHAITGYAGKQAEPKRAHMISFVGIALALLLIIGGIMSIRPGPFFMSASAGAVASIG